MKQTIINIVRYMVFLLLSAIVLLPLLFILLSSFKSNQEIFTNPWGLPKHFNIGSYIMIFRDYGILRNLINSIIYASVACFVVVIVSSMAAYAIARMKWKLRHLCMTFFLLGIMIPIHSLLVPLYITVSRMHLTNAVALIFIYIASSIPTAIFVFTGYLASIPVELEESAIIDGATVLEIFRKIIVPLLRPSVATISIITFLGIWNDLIMALVFLKKEESKTLQLFISQFKGDHFTNYGALLSSVMISIIPLVIVYLIMSEQLINGITQGAVKG